MFTQRGGVCNASNSDKKYGGMREDALVTVQGIKAKLWNFQPLVVKLTAKSDISIDYGPSATAQLVAASSN